MAEFDDAAPPVSAVSFDLGSDLAVMELPSTRPIASDLQDRIRRHPLASVLAVLILGILMGKAWDRAGVVRKKPQH